MTELTSFKNDRRKCVWRNDYFCNSLSGQNTHGVTFLFIIDYVASVSSISDCEHWLSDIQGERVRQMPAVLIVPKQVKWKEEAEDEL